MHLLSIAHEKEEVNKKEPHLINVCVCHVTFHQLFTKPPTEGRSSILAIYLCNKQDAVSHSDINPTKLRQTEIKVVSLSSSHTMALPNHTTGLIADGCEEEKSCGNLHEQDEDYYIRKFLPAVVPWMRRPCLA